MPHQLRPGSPDDSRAAFDLFYETVLDLIERQGMLPPHEAQARREAEARDKAWEWRRPLFEHLAQTADQFWVAERDGVLLGYARSLVRGEAQQLTEFFVRPGEQAAGLGRELLARAFPNRGAGPRLIVATLDPRAQARYLKAGLYPRCPIYKFSRPDGAAAPAPIASAGGLVMEPMSRTFECVEALNQIDRQVLGYRREAEHAWLMAQRQGFMVWRDERPAGYGYVGAQSGPFALLEAADFPAVLAHAEAAAGAAGHALSLEVPMVNQVAADYLLARGYHIGPFVAMFMSNQPVGRLAHYILTTPPFFL